MNWLKNWLNVDWYTDRYVLLFRTLDDRWRIRIEESVIDEIINYYRSSDKEITSSKIVQRMELTVDGWLVLFQSPSFYPYFGRTLERELQNLNCSENIRMVSSLIHCETGNRISEEQNLALILEDIEHFDECLEKIRSIKEGLEILYQARDCFTAYRQYFEIIKIEFAKKYLYDKEIVKIIEAYL